MTEQYQSMDDLSRDDLFSALEDAQDKGLMFVTTHWLLRAVEQKSRNMTVPLAMSTLYHTRNHYPAMPIGRN